MENLEFDERSGVWFTKGTPEDVKRALVELRIHQRRGRVFYGDTETGRDWNEENDVTGYIGCSGGSKPILLLVHNRRSLGSGAVLTHCIVKIVNIATGETLYQHPHYHTAEFLVVEGSEEPGYVASVFSQDPEHVKPAELYANCRTFSGAFRLAAFMSGKRHSK